MSIAFVIQLDPQGSSQLSICAREKLSAARRDRRRRIRLRPVLMTALAMIIGNGVPMALASAQVGEQNAPLVKVVIGGFDRRNDQRCSAHQHRSSHAALRRKPFKPAQPRLTVCRRGCRAHGYTGDRMVGTSLPLIPGLPHRVMVIGGASSPHLRQQKRRPTARITPGTLAQEGAAVPWNQVATIRCVTASA